MWAGRWTIWGRPRPPQSLPALESRRLQSLQEAGEKRRDEWVPFNFTHDSKTMIDVIRGLFILTALLIELPSTVFLGHLSAFWRNLERRWGGDRGRNGVSYSNAVPQYNTGELTLQLIYQQHPTPFPWLHHSRLTLDSPEYLINWKKKCIEIRLIRA